MTGEIYYAGDGDLMIRYIDGEHYAIIDIHPDSFYKAFDIFLDRDGMYVPVIFDIHETETSKTAIIHDLSNSNSA